MHNLVALPVLTRHQRRRLAGGAKEVFDVAEVVILQPICIMRILILGGTKFMGLETTRQLSAAGHELLVYHRGQHESDLPLAVHHLHDDFANLGSHLEELRAFRPEVVLDTFPLREEDGRRVHLLKGIVKRAVILSSADVYRAFNRIYRIEAGPPDPVPLTEDSPLREKLSVQGEGYNKTGVERAARSDPEVPVTILRLPATHGPGDPIRRMFGFAKRFDDKRPAILLDQLEANWRWSKAYVENAAHAIALATTSDRAAGRTYNVADQPIDTQLKWAQRVAAVGGFDGRVVAVASERLPESMRCTIDTTQQYAMDSSRIEQELGYKPVVSVEEGIRRTLAWERSHPPEKIKPEDFDYAGEDRALASLG